MRSNFLEEIPQTELRGRRQYSLIENRFQFRRKKDQPQRSTKHKAVYGLFVANVIGWRWGGWRGRRAADPASLCKSIARASGAGRRLSTCETDTCPPADHLSLVPTRWLVLVDLPTESSHALPHRQTTSSVCFLPVSKLHSSLVA